MENKLEAAEKADKLKAVQIETLQAKLEVTERDNKLQTTEIEALQTKVKSLMFKVYMSTSVKYRSVLILFNLPYLQKFI